MTRSVTRLKHGGEKADTIVKNFSYSVLKGQLGNTQREDSTLLNQAYLNGCSVISENKGSVYRSPIGTDDRLIVTDVSRSPWNRVCRLIISGSNGKKYNGTGWLVAPQTVITAAHCVYGESGEGWASSVRVTPGQNSTSITQDSLESQVFSISELPQKRGQELSKS